MRFLIGSFMHIKTSLAVVHVSFKPALCLIYFLFLSAVWLSVSPTLSPKLWRKITIWVIFRSNLFFFYLNIYYHDICFQRYASASEDMWTLIPTRLDTARLAVTTFVLWCLAHVSLTRSRDVLEMKHCNLSMSYAIQARHLSHILLSSKNNKVWSVVSKRKVQCRCSCRNALDVPHENQHLCNPSTLANPTHS